VCTVAFWFEQMRVCPSSILHKATTVTYFNLNKGVITIKQMVKAVKTSLVNRQQSKLRIQLAANHSSATVLRLPPPPPCCSNTLSLPVMMLKVSTKSDRKDLMG